MVQDIQRPSVVQGRSALAPYEDDTLFRPGSSSVVKEKYRNQVPGVPGPIVQTTASPKPAGVNFSTGMAQTFDDSFKPPQQGCSVM